MVKTEQGIRENWFNEHKATLKQHGDLEVLEWQKPGTSCYYCRYVFDGNKMYISGDIGEAVFWLTWKANVHSFNDVYIDYFEEKLQAYSGDRRDFDQDKAIKRLREWVNDLKADGVKFDHDNMKELFEETRGCCQRWEWVETLHKHKDWISELEPDYWEWMYQVGDKIPIRIHAYLIGLKMASEQLSVINNA